MLILQLSSKIHTKWDAEFCKSTEFQLAGISLSWNDLWLSESERRIVEHRNNTGVWITEKELLEGKFDPSFEEQIVETEEDLATIKI